MHSIFCGRSFHELENIFYLWSDRMVHGNPVHLAGRTAAGRSAFKRTHIHLDVSDLRTCSSHRTSFRAPAQRSKDNYRLYDDAALERLWEILVYRAMGLDLKEIKDLLTLSEKQKNQYLEKKIRGLRQQIRQLNGQMEFISYVQQNGMLPVPTEENTVEKTYMDHIAVLRKMKQDQKREDKEK